MLKKRCLVAFGLIFVLAGLITAQAKKKLSFEQIFKNAEPRIMIDLPRVTGWTDDKHFVVTKKKEGEMMPRSYIVNISSGKETPYRNLEAYKTMVDPGINVNNPINSDKYYLKLIYVKDKDIFLLDTQKKSFKRLTQTEAEEKNPSLSPDGSFVAFTRDNNLFTIDTTNGKEMRITSDGAKFIYNGRASWIYHEEILGRASNYKAFWWSPDSRRIAFMRFADTRVPLFPLYSAEGLHGFLEETPYPKAGDPNPEVKIGIFSIPSGQVFWTDFNEKEDQYFGTPFWTPNSKALFVQWMNRGQDTFKLFSVDPDTGKRKELYTEQQKSWINWLENIHFLKNNKGFIILSDRDGWVHIYLYTMDGKIKSQITSGKYTVTDIPVIDEAGESIYFTARKEDSTRTDLYRIGFSGTGFKRLTFGNYNHRIRVSPGGKYFITTFSNVTTPPRMALCTCEGRLEKNLGDSKAKEFDGYEIGHPEIFRIKTADGYNLPATWILPLNFDANKKYPVLISIYGGPDSGTVYDTWPYSLEGQWLAQEGIIQMSVDHRGSGHFGKEGVALMHRNLGKWEMNDYIEAVKWLHTKPFVDKSKICITGGSYGGFVTCLALTYGADWFTHGVALFSVTDFRLYDSHYTERYMDSPAENPEGYKFTSAMNWAEKYKGMLFIMHGTMDDNVHMQNSIQLIDKLEDLGRHFQMMLYPGGRHGWRGVKETHSRNEEYRFYYRYLLEKPFPENLFK